MNGTTGGHRGLRDAAALAAAAAVAVLATGCGVVHIHVGSSGGAASTGSPAYQQELAYARCVRSHGLPGFPLPSPSGAAGVSWHLTASPGSPAARANDACQHLLSGATGSATASPPGAVAADCLASQPSCYTPQQLRVAYGIQPLLDHGITGRGQTVTLLEFPPPAPATGAYLGETAWNTPPAAGGPGAGGGGFSRLFSRPAYQDGIAGIGAARGVPDVAADADPRTGMALAFTEGGQNYLIAGGGNSVATPCGPLSSR